MTDDKSKNNLRRIVEILKEEKIKREIIKDSDEKKEESIPKRQQ